MGLDDVLPDEADKKGANKPGNTNQGKEKVEYHKTITGPQNKEKKFTEERWEEIERVISEEFDDNLAEVLNNYTAANRFEVIHEAALFLEREELKEKKGVEELSECPVCGEDCSATGVKIGEHIVCPQHPAAKVSKELYE